jgi:hypothetical protein
MTIAIIILAIIGLALIIHDNRRDRKYKTEINRAMDYHRKKYIKELKDGENK